MNKPECVVFDVDDTLYLERDYVRGGLRAVDGWLERNLGVSGFFQDAWAAFERGVRGRIFDAALAEKDFSASSDVIAELVRVYRTHRPDIGLLSDARDYLDGLKNGVALAIVTDGPKESQRAKVEALQTDRWVRTTVITADLGDGYSKPHPRAFRMVERATGYSGESCVYVADNPTKDFVAPKSLGWRTVRVRRAGGLHTESPSGSDVDLEITDLSELHRFFDRQGVS